MPHLCSIPSCDLASLTTCSCCQRTLCREHFVEHDYSIRSKLNELTQQINQITDQLKSFDIQTTTENIRQKLDQWRFDSYKVIDKFYEKKCMEFNRYINEMFNKQEREVIDLQLKLATMINVQQTTNNNVQLIVKNIKNLRQQMTRFDDISSQIDVRPLLIVDKMIDINKSKQYQSDLLKLPFPYQVIERIPFSSHASTSNNQHLLIHQNSNLYLMDQNLTVICQEKWPNDLIQDMCWSQFLHCFFLITQDNVYQIEENTLSIKHIDTIKGGSWLSCTCSNTSLYLSRNIWNSSIDEFDFKSSLEFIKHYKTIETIEDKQRIDSIEYHNGNLALGINDQSQKKIFIELRSITTFDRLWLCSLNIAYSERKIQCSFYDHNTWLVADWATSSLIYLTKDGKLEKTIEYDEVRYINVFDTNKLVISTDRSIYFHEL